MIHFFKLWQISFYQSKEEAYQSWLSNLKDKIIGEPRPTEHCTIEQLKESGIVGVYEETEIDSPEWQLTDPAIGSATLKPVFLKYEQKNRCDQLIWDFKHQADSESP